MIMLPSVMLTVMCTVIYVFSINASSIPLKINPLFYLFLAVIIGLHFEVYYIYAIRGEEVFQHWNRIMSGFPEHILYEGALAVTVISLAICASFLWVLRNSPNRRLDITTMRNTSINEAAVLVVLAVFGTIALIGYAGLYSNNIFSPEALFLSQKRFLGDDAGLNSEVYFYYTLSKFLRVPMYISLICILFGSQYRSLHMAVFFILFPLVCYVPFLFSSRMHLLSIFADVMIAYLVFKERVNRLVVVGAITFALLIMSMVSLQRATSDDVAFSFNILLPAIEAVVDGRYLFDITKLGAFIDTFPSRFDFLYGESYTSLLGSLIPSGVRSVLDEDVTQFLARELFKEPHNSLTPGIFGEAYVNFGYPGMVFLAVIYGATLGLLYKVLLLQRKKIMLFIYLLLLTRMTILLVNSDLIKGVFKILFDIGFVYAAMIVCFSTVTRPRVLQKYAEPVQP